MTDSDSWAGGDKSLISHLASQVLQSFGLGLIEDWVNVDEFQLRILQALLLVLFFNIFMIIIAWKIYGPRIVDRFMKPVPSAVLEDLKQGATELKLPREHSPRI